VLFETPDASTQTVGLVGTADAQTDYKTYIDVAGYTSQSYFGGMAYVVGLDYGGTRGKVPFLSVDGWHTAYAWQGLGVGELEADAGQGGNYFNMQLTTAGNAAGDGNYINGEVGRHPTNNYAISMWYLNLCDGTAMGGNNTGADFSIQNYDDAGNLLGTPFAIDRASGVVNIPKLTSISPPAVLAARKHAPETLTTANEYDASAYEMVENKQGIWRRRLKRRARPRTTDAVDYGAVIALLLERNAMLEARVATLEGRGGSTPPSAPRQPPPPSPSAPRQPPPSAPRQPPKPPHRGRR